jgi:hypothetical protein
MIKKLALFVLFVAFVSVPALAGNTPEFDAVGNDSANFFNDFIKQMVVDNNIDSSGVNINHFSDFTGYIYKDQLPWEFFDSNAASAGPSYCFPGYFDRKAGPWVPISFQWRIVLQMMPETDLDLNIRDCVFKENMTNIWLYAQQTGRWRQSNGKLVFDKNKNPRVTVRALPGIRQGGQPAPFFMDARKQPGLNLVSLQNQLYTSKALWEEGIVMKMPEPGSFNQNGEPVFVLREGDLLDVRFDIPWNNPVDIYYGSDNVVIKYVGIVGMDLTELDL